MHPEGTEVDRIGSQNKPTPSGTGGTKDDGVLTEVIKEVLPNSVFPRICCDFVSVKETLIIRGEREATEVAGFDSVNQDSSPFDVNNVD
jgi:hypothetical protein